MVSQISKHRSAMDWTQPLPLYSALPGLNEAKRGEGSGLPYESTREVHYGRVKSRNARTQGRSLPRLAKSAPATHSTVMSTAALNGKIVSGVQLGRFEESSPYISLPKVLSQDDAVFRAQMNQPSKKTRAALLAEKSRQILQNRLWDAERAEPLTSKKAICRSSKHIIGKHRPARKRLRSSNIVVLSKDFDTASIIQQLQALTIESSTRKQRMSAIRHIASISNTLKQHELLDIASFIGSISSHERLELASSLVAGSLFFTALRACSMTQQHLSVTSNQQREPQREMMSSIICDIRSAIVLSLEPGGIWSWPEVDRNLMMTQFAPLSAVTAYRGVRPTLMELGVEGLEAIGRLERNLVLTILTDIGTSYVDNQVSKEIVRNKMIINNTRPTSAATSLIMKAVEFGDLTSEETEITQKTKKDVQQDSNKTTKKTAKRKDSKDSSVHVEFVNTNSKDVDGEVQEEVDTDAYDASTNEREYETSPAQTVTASMDSAVELVQDNQSHIEISTVEKELSNGHDIVEDEISEGGPNDPTNSTKPIETKLDDVNKENLTEKGEIDSPSLETEKVSAEECSDNAKQMTDPDESSAANVVKVDEDIVFGNNGTSVESDKETENDHSNISNFDESNVSQSVNTVKELLINETCDLNTSENDLTLESEKDAIVAEPSIRDSLDGTENDITRVDGHVDTESTPKTEVEPTNSIILMEENIGDGVTATEDPDLKAENSDSLVTTQSDECKESHDSHLRDPVDEEEKEETLEIKVESATTVEKEATNESQILPVTAEVTAIDGKEAISSNVNSDMSIPVSTTLSEALLSKEKEDQSDGDLESKGNEDVHELEENTKEEIDQTEKSSELSVADVTHESTEDTQSIADTVIEDKSEPDMDKKAEGTELVTVDAKFDKSIEEKVYETESEVKTDKNVDVDSEKESVTEEKSDVESIVQKFRAKVGIEMEEASTQAARMRQELAQIRAKKEAEREAAKARATAKREEDRQRIAEERKRIEAKLAEEERRIEEEKERKLKNIEEEKLEYQRRREENILKEKRNEKISELTQPAMLRSVMDVDAIIDAKPDIIAASISIPQRLHLADDEGKPSTSGTPAVSSSIISNSFHEDEQIKIEHSIMKMRQKLAAERAELQANLKAKRAALEKARLMKRQQDQKAVSIGSNAEEAPAVAFSTIDDVKNKTTKTYTEASFKSILSDRPPLDDRLDMLTTPPTINALNSSMPTIHPALAAASGNTSQSMRMLQERNLLQHQYSIYNSSAAFGNGAPIINSIPSGLNAALGGSSLLPSSSSKFDVSAVPKITPLPNSSSTSVLVPTAPISLSTSGMPVHHHPHHHHSTNLTTTESERLADIMEYAIYLGMDPIADKDLFYIAEWAINAPLPEGWTDHLDEEENEFYYNSMTGVSTYEHPLDEQYRAYYRQIREQRQDSKRALGSASSLPRTASTSSSTLLTKPSTSSQHISSVA